MRSASTIALAALAISFAAASDGFDNLVFSDGKTRSLAEFGGQTVAVQVFCKS